MPVADQDAAKQFYVDVLGCEVMVDKEIWPGARLVQVIPSGSSVAIALLPRDSEIPVALRLGTADAQAAYDALKAAGVTHHNPEVLHMDGAPPMFFFDDPDGNGLVYLQEDGV